MEIKNLTIGLTLSIMFGSGAVCAGDFDLKSLVPKELFHEDLVFKQGTSVMDQMADWKILAKEGDATAQHNLGVVFERGLGRLVDRKIAFKWYAKAAEQGFPNSQYKLGKMYDNGNGVPENDKQALEWYTLAAEQGFSDAPYNLGHMYDNGEGVAENDKTAVKWFTLAAEQDDAEAQTNLGAMYQYGHGVPTDIKRAYMWYNLGSYNGAQLAFENKNKLAKQMTPTDISKAQDMSSRCLNSGYTDC
jgi:TPR repeat protein